MSTPNILFKPMFDVALTTIANSNYTPYVAVYVTDEVTLPPEALEHVSEQGLLTLNLSAQATHSIVDQDGILYFEMRWGGRPRQTAIPYQNIIAMFAKEDSQIQVNFSHPLDMEKIKTLTEGKKEPQPKEKPADYGAKVVSLADRRRQD